MIQDRQVKQRTIAQGMLQLVVGGAFIVLDMESKNTQKVESTTADGTTTAEITGWSFDLIPDEIGHLLLSLAFFRVAAAAQGPLRTWIKAVGAWQLVMLVLKVIGHRIDEIAVTQVTEYGSTTVTTPRWLLPSLVPVLGWAAQMAAAWCLARLCRSLDLMRGATRWTRYAWLMTAMAAFHFLGLIFILQQWLRDDGQPIVAAAPFLAKHFVAFAALALISLIATAALLLHACLGTRAEALAAAQNRSHGVSRR
ncbi:MAG: hypothetical protein AAGG01_02780 [Planctomycetota bacterium]